MIEKLQNLLKKKTNSIFVSSQFEIFNVNQNNKKKNIVTFVVENHI